MKDKKITNASGTAGATAGGLGAGFAVCHAVCQSLVSVLAIMGIVLLGMPLAFLEPYSVPLLILSAAFFVFSVWMCKKYSIPLKTLLKPIGIGLLIAAAVIFSVFMINAYTMVGPSQTSLSEKASAQPTDKCAAPPGYSDGEWKTHMSHHPDLYADCL